MTPTDDYVIFILPADGFGPTGSAIGRKYKAVGGFHMGGGLKSAQRCPLGQHALGIHILRNRGSGLVAMAYRAEHLNTVLRDYPDVLTEDSVRWLGLEDYDESVVWMPEGREWFVYRLNRDDEEVTA